MKIFILTLIGLIGVAVGAVWDNVDIRKDGAASTENIGTRRISQMNSEDLLNQKFLLEILQQVQEPNVSEAQLPQVSRLQPEQLVNDQTLYKGDIDLEMAHVLELSRSQGLLAKDEVYTIANDEHIRQMVGLYRVLVRSRDWDILQRNLLYARIHVNGVLLVNSLLLAIRDRDDTQNLIMPGLHEILPKIYLDEDLLRRIREIRLQSSSSSSFSRQTSRPGILEMIGLNKLWSRNANSVDTLDRRQLWMPWREIHMGIQARKVGRGNAFTKTNIRDDDRIVLPVTLPSKVLREERESRLLINDVGLQSFLQSLINNLCLIESESVQNKQRTRGDSNRAVLARVGLEKNVGSMLESEIRRKDDQIQGQNLEAVRTVDFDTSKDRFIHVRRNMVNTADPYDPFINTEDEKNLRRVYINNDDSSNLRWNQRSSIDGNPIFLRNLVDDYDRDTSQVEWNNNRVNVQLPTTTADDERLLYVNRKRQHAAAINQMNFTGEQPETEFDLNERGSQTDVNQVNKRVTFHSESLGARDDHNVDNREHLIDFEVGMPMDWNRQMAMHRQKKNRVVDAQFNNSPVQRDIGNNNDKRDYQVQDLREVDITNERLAHVGPRRLNQWRKASQQLESVLDERRNTDINRENSKNVYENKGRSWLNSINRNRQNSGRIVEDPRILTTVARGMGNIGIHVGQEVNEPNEVDTDVQLRNNKERSSLYNDHIRITPEPNLNVHNIEGEKPDVWQHRSTRSLVDKVVLNRERYGNQKRDGELLLHSLQQLMARINLEHISLGLEDTLQLQDDTVPVARFNNAAETRLALRLNRMRLNSRRTRILLNRITEVERRLQAVIENEILRGVEAEQRNQIRKNGDIDQLIGEILIGQRSVDQDVNLLNILREILLQTEDIMNSSQKLNQLTMDIENPIVLHLLRRIVQIADLQRQQQLGNYRIEELLMSGVSINGIRVDKLRTYVDTNDVDLINAVDVKAPLTTGQSAVPWQRMVVARQQRLNHQAFTINIDVTANRNKRVVVRTLLGPKTVTSVPGTQLNRQRQNFILLDTYMVDLHSGRNVITRKSHDINWTARDTTPFTEIYKRVMQALEGNVDITLDQLQGQSCRFPHRLLLPRGRVEGLLMQMLVIITPVETDERPTVHQFDMNNKVCGMGMSSINLDQLPLGFPLDRPIESMEEFGSLPNARLMDVQIFHSKQLVADDFY